MSAEIIDLKQFVKNSKTIKVSHEPLVEHKKDEASKIVDEIISLVNKFCLTYNTQSEETAPAQKNKQKTERVRISKKMLKNKSRS